MRSGFFNSNITGTDAFGNPIYDRAEDATFFAEYFSSFIGNGIFPNPSNNMLVQANNDMTVKVNVGKCFIKGYFGLIETEETLTIQAPSSTIRTDLIVAGLNTVNREITLYVKKNTNTVERNSNIYELALAEITVNPDATKINQSNILDTRLNTEKCGIVSGVVSQVDTQEIFQEYLKWLDDMKEVSQEEFDDWFERIKGQLSTDQAGHLQNEIDEISSDVLKNTTDIANNSENISKLSTDLENKTISLTKIYTGSTTAKTGSLSKSISNFKAVLVVARYSTTNTLVSAIYPVDSNSVNRNWRLNLTGSLFANVVISSLTTTSISLENSADCYISAIYGIN